MAENSENAGWLKIGSSFAKVSKEKKQKKERKRDKKSKDKQKKEKEKKEKERKLELPKQLSNQNVLGEFQVPIRGPNNTYTYTVYQSAKRAHLDLYDSRNEAGLQCYHTMPLYERLCDKV